MSRDKGGPLVHTRQQADNSAMRGSRTENNGVCDGDVDNALLNPQRPATSRSRSL